MIESHLVAGPIHYDFLLPLNDASRDMFAGLAPFGIPISDPEAQWLLVGWGARAFYTTTGGYSDVSASTIRRSFIGDASVMRIDTVGPLSPGQSLPRLRLSQTECQHLLRAIDRSFAKDTTGQPIVIAGAGLGFSDRFFEANGKFDMLRTCNTWISRMLRASGVRFGIWTPTAYAVTLSLRWLHGD